MCVLVVAHGAFGTANTAAESLVACRADTIDPIIVAIAGVVVLAIGDALLDKVAEFLKEVQLHASIGPALATAASKRLLDATADSAAPAVQIILRL